MKDIKKLYSNEPNSKQPNTENIWISDFYCSGIQIFIPIKKQILLKPNLNWTFWSGIQMPFKNWTQFSDAFRKPVQSGARHYYIIRNPELSGTGILTVQMTDFNFVILTLIAFQPGFVKQTFVILLAVNLSLCHLMIFSFCMEDMCCVLAVD